MLILSIDTSTTAIGAALHDGRDVIARSVTLDARAHAEHLAPSIRDCLQQAGAGVKDLTAVAVGLGPGPFTGLRVGIATARTMAFVQRIPVRGVCSLDALALAWASSPARQGDSCLVATDARRREVYSATYAVASPGQARLPEGVVPVARLRDAAVMRAADLPADERALPCVGRGGLLYPAALPHAGGAAPSESGALGADAPEVSGDPGADAPGASVAAAGARQPDAMSAALLDVDPGWLAVAAILDAEREGGFVEDPALVDQHERADLEPLYLRRPDADPTAGQRVQGIRKSTLG